MTLRSALGKSALLVLPTVAVVPAQDQTPPVFPAGVEAVYVDVFVTSRDVPVTGLGAADFEVADDGVKQAATLVGTETTPVAALLLFDMSGSVRGQKLRDLKAAAHAFVDGLAERDEGAVLAFSHELCLQARATRDHAALHRAIDGLESGGATALYDALYVALERSEGQGRPLVVLFTDGEDNMSWLGRGDVREAMRRSTALLYVVGTGSADASDSAFVREVAEATGGRAWRAAASSSLKERFLDILGAMRTRYLLAYEPRGVKGAGLHRLEVKVKGRKLDVRHRREYMVAPPAGPG